MERASDSGIRRLRRVDTAVAEQRARTLAPRRFLVLAVASLGALGLVVTTGAIVRLTASGLGCDNWPRCGDKPYPESGHHAFIEFGNRVIALCTIVITVVTWLASRRVAELPSWVRLAALGMFLGTLAQIPLGGLTVIFDLNPLLVMGHFLLAMVVVAAAVIVALEAWSAVAGMAAPFPSALARWGGVGVAAFSAAMVLTGAVSTASGPHSGGEDIPRLGLEIVDAVAIHVRAVAGFGISFLVLGWFLLRLRFTYAGLLRLALALLAALGAQMIVGEVQYRTALPWGLVLVHVGLGTAVWGLTVALVFSLFRPPAPLGSRVSP
jgi:cytochrome c oxidase assembly protein subunit 15